MATRAPTESKDNGQLEIHVNAELIDIQKADQVQEFAAYAFSSDVQLLDAAPLGAKGEAVLRVSRSAPVANLRVLVGPRVEEETANFAELIRRGAQEKHLRISERDLRLDVPIKVFPDIWNCWLRSACFVRGNLNKRVLIGGEYVDFPVCNAKVEVYEVDPLWILIPKLPDDVLDHLRKVIINPIRIPIPHPDPGPEDAPFARTAMSQAVAEQARPLDADLSATLSQLHGASELRYAAQVGSKLQFQQALIANPIVIRPLLCWFWPRLVTTQLVATAKTDDCGHFQTLFFQGCNNHDTPDLYFKARQKLFGWFDVYIYAPTPIACHTWWNYICGTEVNLYTSSPWAQTCSPCPPVIGPEGKNRWVAFMGIGVTGLNRVYGASPDLVGSTTSDNRGLLADGGNPWGGLLLPRLEFSPALEAAGVRYYQLRWRKGDSGGFLPLTGTVTHYYRHDVPTPTGDLPVWSPKVLGPVNVPDGMGHEVPDLFQIPYASVAPEGVWDAPPDVGQIREHFASAKLPSQDIAPGMTYDAAGATMGTDTSGKYQVDVNLFDGNGQPVNIAALGIIYAVPEAPDSAGIVHTVDASRPDLNLVSGNSLIITLHIDNNRCYAKIDTPTISGTPADPCCGVLKYHNGDNVTLSWQAKHPHDFARYSLRVVRGDREVINSGTVPVSASTSPDDYSVDFLMNHNPYPGCAPDTCVVAGFGAYLYVDAMATDGWGSELGYDDDDLRAFVLSKH
jgi:hypothetical protein